MHQTFYDINLTTKYRYSDFHHCSPTVYHLELIADRNFHWPELCAIKHRHSRYRLLCEYFIVFVSNSIIMNGNHCSFCLSQNCVFYLVEFYYIWPHQQKCHWFYWNWWLAKLKTVISFQRGIPFCFVPFLSKLFMLIEIMLAFVCHGIDLPVVNSNFVSIFLYEISINWITTTRNDRYVIGHHVVSALIQAELW